MLFLLLLTACALFFVDIVHVDGIVHDDGIDEHDVDIVHDGIVHVSPLGVEDDLLAAEGLPSEDVPAEVEDVAVEVKYFEVGP